MISRQNLNFNDCGRMRKRNGRTLDGGGSGRQRIQVLTIAP